MGESVLNNSLQLLSYRTTAAFFVRNAWLYILRRTGSKTLSVNIILYCELMFGYAIIDIQFSYDQAEKDVKARRSVCKTMCLIL